MPEIVNVEQAAAWDGPSGEAWVAREAAQNEALRPHSERLLEVAAVGTTDHVLDVGCGTGDTTRACARLAVDGDALGVDLSTAMLERARERAAADGLTNLEFLHGRRAGAPVPGGARPGGREPLRRDVLRRSGGCLRQHRPGDVGRWPARDGGVAGLRPQRVAPGAMGRARDGPAVGTPRRRHRRPDGSRRPRSGRARSWRRTASALWPSRTLPSRSGSAATSMPRLPWRGTSA